MGYLLIIKMHHKENGYDYHHLNLHIIQNQSMTL